MTIAFLGFALAPVHIFGVLAACFFTVLYRRALHGVAKPSSRQFSALAVTLMLAAALGSQTLVRTAALVAGNGTGTFATMSSLGALAGILTGAWVVKRLSSIKRLATAAAGPALSALIVARLGCVFDGCCHGHTIVLAGTSLPTEWWPLLDITVAGLALFAGKRIGDKRVTATPDAQAKAAVFAYLLLRLMIEFIRDDTRYFAAFTFNQAAILLLFSGFIAIAAVNRWSRTRKPQRFAATPAISVCSAGAGPGSRDR